MQQTLVAAMMEVTHSTDSSTELPISTSDLQQVLVALWKLAYAINRDLLALKIEKFSAENF